MGKGIAPRLRASQKVTLRHKAGNGIPCWETIKENGRYCRPTPETKCAWIIGVGVFILEEFGASAITRDFYNIYWISISVQMGGICMCKTMSLKRQQELLVAVGKRPKPAKANSLLAHSLCPCPRSGCASSSAASPPQAACPAATAISSCPQVRPNSISIGLL